MKAIEKDLGIDFHSQISYILILPVHFTEYFEVQEGLGNICIDQHCGTLPNSTKTLLKNIQIVFLFNIMIGPTMSTYKEFK